MTSPLMAGIVFQLLVCAGGLLFIVWTEPEHRLRVSDPGVLMITWSGLYLVLPSVLWVMRVPFPYDHVVYISEAAAERLFYLQGTFVASLLAGYLLLRGRAPSLKVEVDAASLPNGWLLFGAPVAVLVGFALFRFATGGGLIPEASYGDTSFTMARRIVEAREVGGLRYLLTQIAFKFAPYLIIVAGVGAGLLLTRIISRGWRWIWFAIGLFLSYVLLLFIYEGGRSTIFMTLLIALVFADLLRGPISWKGVAVLLLLVLAAFEFFGAFREYRYLGLKTGAEQAYFGVTSTEKRPPLVEFTCMLEKEATGVQIFENAGYEGVRYLWSSITYLIPSQLNPQKEEWLETSYYLSREMLGQRSQDNSVGVAGSMIVDGYRFAGTFGTVFVAFVIGGVFGLINRWLASSWRGASGPPELFKVALVAGFYAWTFNVIRGSLAMMLSSLVFNLILPAVALHFLAASGYARQWLEPLPTAVEPAAEPGLPRRRPAPPLPAKPQG